MNLEHQVTEILAELGLDESHTPLVLEELKQIAEAKALGTLKGKPDQSKVTDISKAQSATAFKSSLRAHSRAAAKQLDTEINSLFKHLWSLHTKYKNGDISLRRYREKARIALKSSTETAFQLGTKSAGIVSATGSLRPLTPQERKWLTSYLKEELKYFDNFLRSVKSESLTRSKTRLSMYAATVKSAYDSGRVLSVGMEVIIHWVLESDNPCPDCKLLHKHSPYTSDTLPTVPKGGQTRCLSHCYCTLRIVKSTAQDVNKLRKKKKSASWHLKKLKQNRKKR